MSRTIETLVPDSRCVLQPDGRCISTQGCVHDPLYPIVAALLDEVTYLRAGLFAYVRAGDPAGMCTMTCASWHEEDCDCGYVDCDAEPAVWAQHVLDTAGEP